jgi:gamma-D-glutamyl-L-lysine dipeptidyl-peptidase
MRCSVPVSSLRREPDDGAEQVTQALLGEPLRVEEQEGGWARVVTAYDYAGWMKVEHLEEGDGAFLAPAGSEPLDLARAYLGAPYEWGGLTAAGIDCSGLVHIAYREAGVLVPRDSWQQEAVGELVSPGFERLGDVVTYGDSGRADHVAFLVANGRILHATARESLGVVEESEPPELAARRRAIVRLDHLASRSRDTSKEALKDGR